MSNVVFPAASVRGLQWDVKRIPTKATLAKPAVSGRAVRIKQRSGTTWKFECSFHGLHDDISDELNTLMGFWLARDGSFDSFLLDLATLTQNPKDSARAGQPLTIDANNCAPLVFSIGEAREQVWELKGVPVIRGNGSALAVNTDYVIRDADYTETGALNANNISYSGVVIEFLRSVATPITADFGWYYRVTFESGGDGNGVLGGDQMEFNAFMYQLYEAQQVTMTTARE